MNTSTATSIYINRYQKNCSTIKKINRKRNDSRKIQGSIMGDCTHKLHEFPNNLAINGEVLRLQYSLAVILLSRSPSIKYPHGSSTKSGSQ